MLDHAGELDLEPARQVHPPLGLEDVRDATLAGLTVDPDHRLIGAAQVVRVDRQIRDAPRDAVDRGPGRAGVLLHPLEALLDGVLVRAGEGREDEVTAIRVAFVDLDLVAVLDGAPDRVDIREVDLRVDALGEQVHPHGDEVDIAGALAVAEQAALDPVRAGEQAQLGRRDGSAAVGCRLTTTESRRAIWRIIHSIESA